MGTKIDAGLVALVLVAAILIYMAFGGAQGNLSLAGVSGTASGSCASAGEKPTITSTLYTVDPSQNNKQTLVATTLVLAKPDSSQVYNTTTTSTTKAQDSTVPCGARVSLIGGDAGSTYYYNGVTFDATGISHEYNLQVVPSGAASFVLQNSTSGNWGSTVTESGGAISDPSANIQIKVKPPTTAGSVFGDKGWAMCFVYDSANFTQVRPTNYKSAVTIPHVTASTTLNSVSCWEMNGVLTSNGGDVVTNLYLDRAAALTGGNSSITIKLVDKTSMLFNGNLVDGFDTSVTDGLNTDAGRADVSTSSAVIIGV
jgi:hypothetical protein